MIWADSSACAGLNIFDQVMAGCTGLSIFQPSSQDLSLTFLRMIFGSVGGALYGMSNPLVGTIFRIFNTGVLLITSALITYTVFLTVIGSSQDGSPMGGNSKGMLNPWVVVRMVGGSSLLIPSFSGYSAMQVLVMYTVVQGVGFADTVWSASLDYISSTGNSVVSTPVEHETSNLEFLATTGGMMDNFYRSSLCMMNQIPVNTATCTSTPDQCKVAYTNSAGYSTLYVKFPFSCGEYSLNISTITDQSSADTPPSKEEYSMKMEHALKQSIGILQSAAGSSMQSVTATLVSFPNQPYSSATDTLNGTAACTSDYCPAASAYASAASAYLEVVDYTYQVLVPPANLEENTAWTNSAGSRGWISAGMYYFDLAQNYSLGSAAYSSNSKSSGTKLKTSGPYVVDVGIPGVPTEPNAPNTAAMTYPVQIQDAYYFNYEQTSCDGASCGGDPAPECNACQAVQLIDDMSSSMLSSKNETAASLEADKMYSHLIRQIFVLLHDIDRENYCNLLPNGIASGWAFLTPCDMVMPLARFNRLVLGGTIRVMMGLNVAWLDSKPCKGANCEKIWNGNCKGDVTDIIAGDGSSSKHCLSAGNKCRASSNEAEVLQNCSSKELHGPCMSGMFGFFPFLYSASEGGYMDPIYSASQMGMQMMGISVTYWMSVTEDVFTSILNASWVLFGLSAAIQIPADIAAAGLTGLVPIVGGVIYSLAQVVVNIMKMFFEMSKAVLEMYLPLGASLTAIVFGLGVMLGIYMPFMPFMLYLFGVIGWIMAVIEAMVAAPLVALGITHPEGHDLLGKSEQAVMLLLGVFIRPVTMILGLLFAMNLAQIAVQLLNYGFLFVFMDIAAMNTSTGSAMTNAFIILGALTVYAYILMAVIDQSYSLIYQVPDKILRWIGGPQDTSSTAQMVNQVKGQVQQLGSKGGEAGSSTAGRAPGMGGTTASGSKYNKERESAKGSGGNSASAH